MNYRAVRFVVVSLLLGGGTSAFAEQRKFEELSAEWWQFMSSIPASENPLFDTTGEKCVVGQRGDVWFIGGVLGATLPDGTFLGGGGTANRSCKIPQGKTLFFPVINTAGFDSPNICGQDENHFTKNDLLTQAKTFVDQATNMSVTLDGRQIDGFKRVASTFEISLPERSLWDQLCTFFELGGVPGGIYQPGAQDGFYATVRPSIGRHTLRIKGQAGEFALDVVYNLDVVPSH